jgi:hypothetical protein
MKSTEVGRKGSGRTSVEIRRSKHSKTWLKLRVWLMELWRL